MTLNKRSWASLALLLFLSATAIAQSPTPRPKFGGSTVVGAPAAAPAAAVAPAAASRASDLRGANVKTELGIDVAIAPDVQIKRLQKKVAELTQLSHSLQAQVDALNKSLEAIQRSTITYRCEQSYGVARSINSLGVAMECSPYGCDASSGRCLRPPCATSAECVGGTVCDVGGTNLCVSVR